MKEGSTASGLVQKISFQDEREDRTKQIKEQLLTRFLPQFSDLKERY